MGTGSSGSGGGGGGGGGGANYTSAQETKMPSLSGSEKQVSWATDIRNRVLTAADNLVEDAARGEKGEWWRMEESFDNAVSLQSAEKTRETVVNALKNITSARQIIDNRKSLTKDAVVKMAKSIDRAEGRKFKSPKKQKKAPKSGAQGYAKPKSR